jgi:hypothetical protein
MCCPQSVQDGGFERSPHHSWRCVRRCAAPEEDALPDAPQPTSLDARFAELRDQAEVSAARDPQRRTAAVPPLLAAGL